jgi:hypothetical protein
VLDDNYLSKNHASTQVLYLNKRILSDFFQNENCCPITNNVATDIRNQVNYFIHELETTEKKAGNTLRSATTLPQAMQGMKEYERFGIAGNREKFAQQILKELT